MRYFYILLYTVVMPLVYIISWNNIAPGRKHEAKIKVFLAKK